MQDHDDSACYAEDLRGRQAVRGTGADSDRTPYPPQSLTADQIRYALSQWFLAHRYGRRAGRILLEDAAALIRYHRHHNASAKLNDTRKKRGKLLKSGIDVDRIRVCLDSNFAL